MGIVCSFSPTKQTVDGFGTMAADVVVDIVLLVGIGVVDKGEYLVLACIVKWSIEPHVMHYALFGTNSNLHAVVKHSVDVVVVLTVVEEDWVESTDGLNSLTWQQPRCSIDV